MLTPLEPEEFRAWREVCERAGYHDQGLLETLGPVEIPNRAGPEEPHFLYLTRRGRALDTLIRLFLLGAPVEREAAREALGEAPLKAGVRAGLLELGADGAVARVRLMPFRGLLLAVDQPGRPGVCERRDQVMGLTGSTIALANFTLRQAARQTLDLGTGSGVQAFLAAGHSHAVLATDTSRRALEFAAFNAGLNGCPNVRLVEGDAFEPARGQRFDLIVSNPPFAVSPACRFLYRDSGLAADGFARRLVSEAPPLLEEGGYCQVVCDWVHLAGQDWQERLAGWFQGSGCDVWVLRTATSEAGAYAHMWIRDTEHPGGEEAARLHAEWMSYYAGEGIEAISTGLMALRRRSADANWVRFDELPEGTSGPFGDAVVLGFRLRDFLEARREDAALLEETFRLSPGLRLDQQCEWAEGAWRIQSAQLRLQRGLKFAGNVDRQALALLTRCDGRRRLKEALAELAAALGTDAGTIAPQCLTLLRRLIERGYVLPAHWDAPPG
jgi:SAM-dependent methyltransferase